MTYTRRAALLGSFLCFSSAVPLVGCGFTGTQTVTPAQVAAAEKAVTIAETLALNYTRLPPCPTAKLCSDPATKVKVKAYGQAAHDAAVTLRTSSAAGAPAALAALEAALTALTSAVPTPATN